MGNHIDESEFHIFVVFHSLNRENHEFVPTLATHAHVHPFTLTLWGSMLCSRAPWPVDLRGWIETTWCAPEKQGTSWNKMTEVAGKHLHPDQWEPYWGGSCIYSKCTSAISQGQKIHQRQSEDPPGSGSRQGFVLFIQRLLGHWLNWLEWRYHWAFLWLFCSWKMKLNCFPPQGRSEITDTLSSS